LPASDTARQIGKQRRIELAGLAGQDRRRETLKAAVFRPGGLTA